MGEPFILERKLHVDLCASSNRNKIGHRSTFFVCPLITIQIGAGMPVYLVSIFISALLLFQVQPMIAKYILPWFGGITAVWSTVMLFFQVLLTGGYAYGHYLVGRVRSGQQWKVHIALLAISVLLMLGLAFLWASPITPPASWKPQTVSDPIGHIFLLLAISIGLPYFMLSTNSPLMQAWFARRFPGTIPYRLYSLSNFGSLLALVTYPVLVEPLLTLRAQGWMWSGLYLVFACVAGYVAFLSHKPSPIPSEIQTQPELASQERPKTGTILLWIALSATASILLLAVTNEITQEVAPIPFLWIVPLTLYLLSFIFAFENERWYQRIPFTFLLLIGSAGFLYIATHPFTNYLVQLILYAVLLFTCFMVCHGELYRLRPATSHLTMFYLMVSIGGAVGGLLVNFVAPLIFKGYFELNYGLAFAWLLLAAMTFVRPTPIKLPRLKFGFDLLVGACAVIMLLVTIFLSKGLFAGAKLAERNFYGVLRVWQTDIGDGQQVYTLMNGITLHGFQYLNPTKRDQPTAYYIEEGGGGLAILNHPARGKGMQVGVLGLGVGTLAAYGEKGDSYRFYEINPQVVSLAEGQGGYFSYLKDSQAKVSVVLGDGRISLERELADGAAPHFDVLVLDAFSSDSIPVHLLTQQAFEVYLENLAPDGVIAVHISNKHLDLVPVLWQLARYFNLKLLLVRTQGDIAHGIFATNWVLLARQPALLENPAIARYAEPMEGYSTQVSLWTDDYSNLFQILR
jgi:hypothetical protein